MPLLAERVSLIDSENAFKLGPWIRELEAAGKRVIKCNIGEPDFPLPRHIADEVKRQIDLGQTHYCDPQGIEPLRVAIARSVAQSRGITVTPDRVVVFPGAKPPIGLSQQTYCNPGDEVIYPSPGFPIYESFTRYVGAVPRPLHLREENDFACTGDELAPLINDRTRLIFLNFPSNPTGGVASREQLRELAGVIRRKADPDVRVYSDEVYEAILYDGAEHHSIACELPDNTIIVSGVSKSYAWTGGRIGWAIFPTADEAAIFRNLNINYFSCVPAYNQFGAKVAIESPESVTSIAKMNAAFETRRNMVWARLNLIDGVRCNLPRAAFYMFPNIAGVCARLGCDATEFQRFLLYRHGVATLDRRSFGRIGSEGKHFLRISIATAYDELEEAMDRIRVAAFDVDGFNEWRRS